VGVKRREGDELYTSMEMAVFFVWVCFTRLNILNCQDGRLAIVRHAVCLFTMAVTAGELSGILLRIGDGGLDVVL
jgi:hypothetical protein